MTSYAHGHDAEKVAAAYLEQQGYEIVAINWRHPRAEIDIIARNTNGLVLLVEVKYRRSTAQGSGLDYITPRKIRQMRFAAELWAAITRYGGEYMLAAIELTGDGYQIADFIEDIA